MDVIDPSVEPAVASRRNFWFLVSVLLGLVVISGVARLNEPREIISWQTDFTSARQESERTHKPLFAYFTADWCEPCQNLKHTTWANVDVARALQGYVPVKIDVDANQGLALQYGAELIPHFVVLNDQGNVLKTESGALDSEEFVAWLNARLQSH